MFRASGSFGGNFYVEHNVREVNHVNGGRPIVRRNNNTEVKNQQQALKINLKQNEASLAKLKKDQDALKRKIEKEEEARLARMKRDKAALDRKIRKQEEECRKKQNQQMKAINQKKTQPQGVRGKQEVVIARTKITKEQNVYVRRAF